MSQEFSVSPFAKALTHILALWNANGFYIICTMHSCQIWALYNTFTVPEAPMYKLNKTITADTDYEHINRKKQELAWKS